MTHKDTRPAGRLRLAAEELERERALLEGIIQSNDQPIFAVDHEFRYLVYNAAHAAAMKAIYGAEIRRGASILDCQTVPEDRAKVEASLRRSLAGESFVEEEWSGDELRARHLFEIAHTPLRDHRGAITGAVVFVHDVTEQRLAQEQIRRLNEELAIRIGELTTAVDALRRSNSDLEQFASVVSHDLQEPLRLVAGFVQLLQRQYAARLDTDEAREFIGHIVEGTSRAQKMIADLLDLSRLTTRARPPEPVNCEDVLDRTLADLQDALAKSGATITHDHLPVIRADAAQMRQLFQNLIGNAIKFRGAAAPRIHVSATAQGPAWLFTVRDNGIGIAPEHRERIFVIFQRLHTWERYPGTGIGLAICKKIVERHGGRIWVESTPGGGSTFFFTIPTGMEHP